MIKRRFSKGGDSSDSSSSSSDSDSDSLPDVDEEEEKRQENEEIEAEEEEQNDEDEVVVERAKSVKKKKKKKRNQRNKRSSSPGSGYESEDSSVNDIKVDSSGLLTSEEESIDRGGQIIKDSRFIKKASTEETDEGDFEARDKTANLDDAIQADFAACILQCKSVFKCRLCPRIVCLSEDTVKAHLNSKRHARSKKLFGEGRLKLMLNSDGEIEEDQETHAERHIRTVALAQELIAVAKPAKADQGRRRQGRRKKKKQLRNSSNKEKSEDSSKNPKKKQRKIEV